MPAWQSHYAENKTIEEVNADKIDYADLVLTRAQRICKQVAQIPGTRGRNVDPDLEAQVEDSPALHKEYWGNLPQYDKERAPSELCDEFLSNARYPLLDNEPKDSPPKDYLKMKAPIPSYDQGHDVHQGFGSLKPTDVFWQQRLHEPGKKLKPGDWPNEPCALSPVELAEQCIAADNREARRRDRESRRQVHSTTRNKLRGHPDSPSPSTRKKRGSLLDGATESDADSHRSKRLRPLEPPLLQPEEPQLSNRQRRKLEREAEKKERRKAHDKHNRALLQARRIRNAPRDVYHAKHIVAPGPTSNSQVATPSPPSSPVFSPELPEFDLVRRSPTLTDYDSDGAFLLGRSNNASPAPSSSAHTSDWEDRPDELEEGDDDEESDFAEQGQDLAGDDEQVDWEAIEALGLDANSIYGAGMPNPDSLPTPGSAPRSEFKLRTTSTGWTGGRSAPSEVVALLWAWTHWALGPILQLFSQIAFVEGNSTTWTLVKDRFGRIIAVRSPLMHFISGFTTNIKETLTKNPSRPSPFMQQVINEVIEFVRITSKKESGFNVRGFHWFHISGWDRQIKGIPDLRAWSKLNTGPLKWLFRDQSPWRRLNGVANLMVQAFFPGIFRRYMRCIDFMAHKYSIQPFYGVFWQFCINWSESRLLVDCWPHVDAANLAIGVCVIWIFGQFDSSEVCWLVIWEANVIIELPAGVFLAYPSSLFYHFNVNQQDIRGRPKPYVPHLVVGPKGQKPTRENTVPLTKRNAEPEAWEKGNVRGSAVWFCQGSMYQPSELGVPTMKEARARGMNVNVDLDDLMERGELF